MRTRRFWGWGYEDESADPSVLTAVEAGLSGLLGMSDLVRRAPPRIDEIALRAPRVSVPASLQTIVTADRFERASHAYGKSYRDLVRAIARDFSNPPDLVAYPETDADVARLLDWCAGAGLAAIPFGGGSSVCGGVEPAVGGAYRGTLSIDLAKLAGVFEIDAVSRAARIGAGTFGPELEAALRPHGLSLRHYPQSFEFSTLGGWIATRSGGHFATLYTHIDELVQSLTVVAPSGRIATRRLPGDGAGPSPERLFIGSEGILGIITEAWMRVFERPRHRASLTARYPDFSCGAGAVRAVAQAGLYPANCRLLDPMEAMLNGAGGGDVAVLLVAFESSDHPLDSWIARAAELCRDAGGDVPASSIRVQSELGEREGAAGAWRQAFVRAPYLRDELVLRGVFVETFETAVTWDRFDALVARVSAAARAACGKRAIVTCRITHAYPDGAAPYFTVITPARAGVELAQWDELKAAITDAMLECGGTVTHHHAVGRDVVRWYEAQRSDGYARALAGAKRALDPSGVLNPGVLLPP